jgi:hypothetical protein
MRPRDGYLNRKSKEEERIFLKKNCQRLEDAVIVDGQTGGSVRFSTDPLRHGPFRHGY